MEVNRMAPDIELPDGWHQPRVIDIAARRANATVGGPFGSDLVAKDYVDSGVPVIRGQNMGQRYVAGEFAFVSPAKAKTLQANHARPSDLVFTQRGTLGQVALVPTGPYEEYLISQSQMKLTLDCGAAAPGYVHQYFASALGQKQILDSAIQTGVPHTNLGILRNYAVPMPRRVDEQEAIAAALTDADTLIDSLEQLLTKKRQIKQGAMQELFNPAQLHARTMCLEQMSGFITKGSTPTTYGFGWESDGIVFLRSECVSPEGLDLTQSMFISEKAHAALRRSAVAVGDLLMTITGNVGRVAIATIDCNINQHIARIRISDPEVNPGFIYHQLSRLEVREELESITTGQAYPQLSLRQVRERTVQLPSRAEQDRIAETLSDMDDEIATLESRLTKARALKQAMAQALLTGRIRLVEPAA